MNWILIQNIAAYAIMAVVFINGAKDIYEEIKNRNCKENRCSDFPTPEGR